MDDIGRLAIGGGKVIHRQSVESPKGHRVSIDQQESVSHITSLAVLGSYSLVAEQAIWQSTTMEIASSDSTVYAGESLGSLATSMEIEILSVDHDQCRGRMPVAPNRQPAGHLHGGASGVLIETLGSYLAQLQCSRKEQAVPMAAVGVELSVSHVRSVSDGYVYGDCRCIYLGRSSAVYLVEIVDDDERLIAHGRLSCRFIAISQPSAG